MSAGLTWRPKPRGQCIESGCNVWTKHERCQECAAAHAKRERENPPCPAPGPELTLHDKLTERDRWVVQDWEARRSEQLRYGVGRRRTDRRIVDLNQAKKAGT